MSKHSLCFLHEKAIDFSMYEDRIEKAVELFHQGYNCSQSVVAAFADLYGFTAEQALRMAASFGGGIGRMRETCGAAMGMFLLTGLETGTVVADDREEKSANYKDVQTLAAKFKENAGSLLCRELLQLAKDEKISYEASPRTDEYYKTRGCSGKVALAARLYANFLEQRQSEAQ